MAFVFLQEEIESIMLFASAPVYVTIISVFQSKNLKILKAAGRKGIHADEKKRLHQRLRKLKLLSPVFLLIGAVLHTLAYLYFAGSDFRAGYFISIGIMYIAYVLAALINFYLKGAGVLKDVGEFGGLPGN